MQEPEITITCESCGNEFTIISDAEDDPKYCPFCSAEIDILEELDFD